MQLLKSLHNNFLYNEVKLAIPIFERIFKESLHEYDNGKRVIILMDYGMPQRRLAPMMALGYYMAAHNLGLFPKIINIGNNAITRDTIEKMLKIPEESIFILTLSNKLLFKDSRLIRFNKLITIKNHKKLTSTGLGAVKSAYFSEYISISNVNFEKMHRYGLMLKRELDRANIVRIKTDNGTDVKFELKNRIAKSNDGYYKNTIGGNMPVGEVFIAPIENRTEGKIVIDGSIRTINRTYLIRNPVTLVIKNGKVKEIIGGEGARLLRDSIEYAKRTSYNKEGVDIIGELGIGINPRAKVNGPTIVNEKSLGTFHVAIGSNWYFGGKNKTNIHIDQVVRNPNIFIDGKKLILKKKG